MIGSKRIYPNLWVWLLLYFLSSRQNDYYQTFSCHDNHLSLTSPSIMYYECFFKLWSWGRRLHGTTSWIYCAKGLVWFVNLVTLFMVSNNLHTLGLENSVRHIVQTFGWKHNKENHSVLYCHTSLKKYVYLMVYVDDIIIIGNDFGRLSDTILSRKEYDRFWIWILKRHDTNKSEKKAK